MTLLFEAFAWLANPQHWGGAGGILARVGEHLALTAAVLGVAAALALPAGVLVGHFRRGRVAVVAVAGAARAVPTLGLLTLLGLALGIGVQAPFIALVVLAIPSMMAGAYAGVEAIDQVAVDASRAQGMNDRQIIFRVELPLAAPVIVGGLRAAALQVVATATLAAYIADIGLGRYIFSGLKSRDYAEMLAGSLLVAVLALILEVLLAGLQRRVRRRASPAREDARFTTTPTHRLEQS